jgi:hypothetical protein
MTRGRPFHTPGTLSKPFETSILAYVSKALVQGTAGTAAQDKP